jgi:hypothetical protein
VGYREHAPSPALAPFVTCFWEAASNGEAHRVLPDGAMDVLFTVGEAAARVIGPMTRAIVTGEGALACVVGVRFRPGAAIDVLGVAARELRNESVPVADVWGAEGRSLDARLADARDADEVRSVIEGELTTRIARTRAPDPRVARAVAILDANGGELPIPAVAASVGARYGERMNITKVTPVRIVDRIEPCLPFWCDALGYEKRAEVPHEGALGFVLLENAAGEVMLQTQASLEADLPVIAKRKPHTVLFIEVKSLEAARNAAKDAEVLVKERTTFYGMREMVVADPAGTIVVFAEKKPSRAIGLR